MHSKVGSAFPVREPDDFEADDSLPLRDLHRLAGGLCSDCRRRFTHREAVYSIVLGFKNGPRCLSCLGTRLCRQADELREQLVAHIHRRECFLRAWREAELRDAAPPSQARQEVTEMDPFPSDVIPPISSEWDAGDMGCGELVMALRLRMNDLPAGAVLKVTATDPAAPEDLPAWCRLSGHTLLAMQHPNYFIRRKGD